eukprot:85330-Hanusia_phi.AAC.1
MPPAPERRRQAAAAIDRDIETLRETSYDLQSLPLLVEDQKTAYDAILARRVSSGAPGMFFLDAPGGTGK